MPYAEVSVTKGFFSEEEKGGISENLTKVLLDAEGLNDNIISRSIALIEIKEFNNLYVGGKRDGKDKIVVKIFAFSEALSKEKKEKLYSDITQIFIECSEKTKFQNGNNVWCMIVPLEADNFGVGGNSISLEATRKFVATFEKNIV